MESLHMKRDVLATFALAVVSAALLATQPAAAQNSAYSPATSSNDSSAAKSEAAEMVSAKVALLKELDAKKVQPGAPFKTRLDDTIHLKNGTELPHGTLLVGSVTTDNLQAPGKERLALRFTEAQLKDGKTFPIQAMIVGVGLPQDTGDAQVDNSVPLPWDASMLQIDQVNAISGADLHSRIASDNSGVFVATKKDDVKLPQGSQLTLAIAALQSPAQNGGAE
jgi:hypothetical protein